MLEVQTLKKHITAFQHKIAKSTKLLTKRQEEHKKNQAQLSVPKIHEQDIYELDSLHNSLTDFLNNLEMSLHKLGYLEQEIENIRQN